MNPPSWLKVRVAAAVKGSLRRAVRVVVPPSARLSSARVTVAMVTKAGKTGSCSVKPMTKASVVTSCAVRTATLMLMVVSMRELKSPASALILRSCVLPLPAPAISNRDPQADPMP